MKTRVLIADSHELFREAISLWLCRNSEFELLTSATDGREAIALAHQWQPDVILMDAVMPHLNGIDATRRITQELPDTKIIVVSETISASLVHAALEAGAAGYLSKYCSSDELIRAVHEVVLQGTYLCSAASTLVVQRYLGQCNAPCSAEPTPLTPRQRYIVQQIAEGMSIKRIAQQLGLSPKTIDWHKGQIMKKLGIDSLAGLVRYAMVEGLTCHSLSPAGTS
jgi:DNA-binding NarL/FixJ family response regulator